jgi:L-ascorbate metabolism protein UlaG (beta-lactamase superfamily)
MTKIIPLGHCGFMISENDTSILIDPWKGNKNFPEKYKNSFGNIVGIFATHGHRSHLGDSKEIAEENNCYVFSVHEVSLYLISQGLSDKLSIGMNLGGTVDVKGWSVTLVKAVHSSW